MIKNFIYTPEKYIGKNYACMLVISQERCNMTFLKKLFIDLRTEIQYAC